MWEPRELGVVVLREQSGRASWRRHWLCNVEDAQGKVKSFVPGKCPRQGKSSLQPDEITAN